MPAPSTPTLPADLPVSHELLEVLLSISQTGIMALRPVYDADGTTIIDLAWVHLNPAAQQLLKLPQRPTKSFLMLFPTVDAASVFGFYRDAFLSGQVARRQNNYQQDGLDGYYLLVAQRQGEVLLVSFDDTNTHVSTSIEEELRASQARELAARAETQRAELQRVFEQAPVAICVFRGPAYVLEIVNPFMGRMLGRTLPQLLGQPFAEAVPELNYLHPILDEVCRSGQPYVAQESAIRLAHHAADEVGYFNFVYEPLHDEQGQVTGIICVATEVSEQVNARAAVEATAQRLRLLTDALPVLIGYLDRERRYRFANHAYRSWFGLDPADLLGRPVHEVMGEQQYAATEAYMGRALTGERLGFETRMPYPQATAKHIYTDYIPDVQNGEVRGFYTLVTDITEQTLIREQVQELNQELAAINEEMVAANEELRDTNNRLSHTNVDLDTFVYTASHDLRAPIANIEGLLLALNEQLPVQVQQDPDVTHLLHLMHDSVARFQRTLGHLTDVSKLQQAHTEPAKALNLSALADAVRLDLAAELAATGGQLTIDVVGCPTLSFSPKNLRSILYNLLSNAIKYHAPGRPPQVLLHAYCAEGQILLAVHDNGLGLNEEQQSRLFVMFRRLHTHVEGTGVGLYMVKRMVENAGGRIQVQSQPGIGSIFTVLLPETGQHSFSTPA